MSAQKVKVKVTKKRIKVKNILITGIILLLVISTLIEITKLPVKNIYITANEILKDKEIIELAELNDYPPYLKIYFNNISSSILSNLLISLLYISSTSFIIYGT